MSLLCGLAKLSGLCDEVRGSDIQWEPLAKLLLLREERSQSRRLLIMRSRKHTQLGRDPGVGLRNVLEGSSKLSGLKVPRGGAGECC